MSCKKATRATSGRGIRIRWSASSKPFKTISYNNPELKPVSDGLAIYKDKLYGTKEDLKYMPKRIRLVRLPSTNAVIRIRRRTR